MNGEDQHSFWGVWTIVLLVDACSAQTLDLFLVISVESLKTQASQTLFLSLSLLLRGLFLAFAGCEWATFRLSDLNLRHEPLAVGIGTLSVVLEQPVQFDHAIGHFEKGLLAFIGAAD